MKKNAKIAINGFYKKLAVHEFFYLCEKNKVGVHPTTIP